LSTRSPPPTHEGHSTPPRSSPRGKKDIVLTEKPLLWLYSWFCSIPRCPHGDPGHSALFFLPFVQEWLVLGVHPHCLLTLSTLEHVRSTPDGIFPSRFAASPCSFFCVIFTSASRVCLLCRVFLFSRGVLCGLRACFHFLPFPFFCPVPDIGPIPRSRGPSEAILDPHVLFGDKNTQTQKKTLDRHLLVLAMRMHRGQT